MFHDYQSSINTNLGCVFASVETHTLRLGHVPDNLPFIGRIGVTDNGHHEHPALKGIIRILAGLSVMKLDKIKYVYPTDYGEIPWTRRLYNWNRR
jgi:hypothetical protein